MAIYENLYPQGNFLDIRANAPTSTDYNIQVMEDLVRNLPGGGIRDLLAPATAATLSLPYDAIQAATRTTEDDISRAMETAGMYGPKDIASEAYGLAFGRERPLSSAIERTIGASGPLAERINNLNLFNSAVAAEKPTVPNLSLGYNMPTFDLGTGITNTTAATNMYSPFMDNRETVNQDLIQQLIEENQAKRNLFARPNMLDIAGGITQTTPSNINLEKLNSLGFGTNYGVANTPNVIGDLTGSDVYESDDGRPYYIDSKGNKILAPGTVEAYKKQSGYSGQKPSGIAKLFEFLGKLPTPFNLARLGLDSLTGINNRMQNSMFGKSKTLAEYFNNRKIAKATGSKDFMNRPRSERNYTGPSGGNNTGGDTGAKGAADSFSNKSGMGRTGY